jgi:Putative prokaryotic signal transducing protein
VRPLNFTVRCTVALVRLLSPESDSEIVAIVAMLDAHEIPSFVRGGGMGGLFPGVQINAYNTRDIMVPEEKAAAALELLRDFQSSRPAPEEHVETPKKSGRLRNLFELLLFGWFMPGSRTRARNADGTPNNRWRGP